MAEVAEVDGILWPHEGTVGHITVTTSLIRGRFDAAEGDDGMARCDLVQAGKYRNGAARSWCRTHQRYWGVKADIAACSASGIARCAGHADSVGYVLHPRVIDVADFATVVIGLNLSGSLRVEAGGAICEDATAMALAYPARSELFDAADIVQVNITPPAVLAWNAASRSGAQVGCVCCSRCGHPHLDLGSFSERVHRRHYCGNCGHDGTHSQVAMISNPIYCLLELYGARLRIGAVNVHSHPVL